MILAEARAERPQPARTPTAPQVDPSACPFCGGHEAETPPAVLSLPEGSDDWQVRVVPNKYPALLASDAGEAAFERDSHGAAPQQPVIQQPGYGHHEVVIETARHSVRLTDLTAAEWALVLAAYQQRLAAHDADPRIEHVQVFKNVGRAAGATIEHAHSQIVALPLTPARTFTVAARLSHGYVNDGTCLLCAEIERETRNATRVVAANESFAAYCPFASRSPCEVWIVPRSHAARFEATDGDRLAALAELLLHVSRKIDLVLDNPDYNLVLQQSRAFGDSFHWHWQFIPRVATLAGFEWATGCYINTMSPERAAEALRSV